MWCRNPASACALGLIIAGASIPADATQFIDLGAGSNWLSTTDQLIGSHWLGGVINPGEGVPATSPYGNALTDTTVLDPNRMMWACGGAGHPLCTINGPTDTAGDGPNQAFFALPFDLKASNGIGALRIIGDDFLELRINGHFIFNEALDLNQANNGIAPDPDPDPFLLTINGLDVSIVHGNPLHTGAVLHDVLNVGSNVIAIEAMDGVLPQGGTPTAPTCIPPSTGGTFELVPITGGDWCLGDRVFEYAFVSGSITVPEPASLAVFGVSLVALGAARRRYRATRLPSGKVWRALWALSGPLRHRVATTT